METFILATLHISIWIHLYSSLVWNDSIEKAAVSNATKRMFKAWTVFALIMFLVSVTVIAGNAFFYLKRW